MIKTIWAKRNPPILAIFEVYLTKQASTVDQHTEILVLFVKSVGTCSHAIVLIFFILQLQLNT